MNYKQEYMFDNGELYRKNRWIATLSNGIEIDENDLLVQGDKSPYRKLTDIMKEDNLEINSMTMEINGKKYHISKDKNARFPSEGDIELHHRRTFTEKVVVAGRLNKCMNEKFIKTVAEVDNLKISLIVNEDSDECWLQVQRNGK